MEVPPWLGVVLQQIPSGPLLHRVPFRRPQVQALSKDHRAQIGTPLRLNQHSGGMLRNQVAK